MSESLLLDPIHYDALHGTTWPGSDVAYWRELAIGLGGPVLELGCGTGRIALRLWDAGVEVCGLDRCGPMVLHAQRKAIRIGCPAPFIHADAREFSVDTKFRLIAFTFNGIAMLTSLDDVTACLDRVVEHLEPGGAFAIDLLRPPKTTASKAPKCWARYPAPDGSGEIEVMHEFEYRPATRRHDMRFSFRLPDGSTRRETLQMRLHHPEELETLLAARGFDPPTCYGGYAQEPFEPGATDLLLVARRG